LSDAQKDPVMKPRYNSRKISPWHPAVVDQDQHSRVPKRGSGGVVSTAKLSRDQGLRNSCHVHGGLTWSSGQLTRGRRISSWGSSRCQRHCEAVQLLVRETSNPILSSPSPSSLLHILLLILLVLSQITLRHAPPPSNHPLLRRGHPLSPCHSQIKSPFLWINFVLSFTFFKEGSHPPKNIQRLSPVFAGVDRLSYHFNHQPFTCWSHGHA